MSEINFPGEPKMVQEHIRFSRKKKCHKKRSNFPGDLVQNFLRTHNIFQEKEKPKEQIKFSRRAFIKFCKNRYDFPGEHTPNNNNRYFAKLPRRMLSCFLFYWLPVVTSNPFSKLKKNLQLKFGFYQKDSM